MLLCGGWSHLCDVISVQITQQPSTGMAIDALPVGREAPIKSTIVKAIVAVP